MCIYNRKADGNVSSVYDELAGKGLGEMDAGADISGWCPHALDHGANFASATLVIVLNALLVSVHAGRAQEK